MGVDLFISIHFFNAITLCYLQKLHTLLTMLIVDAKVGDLCTKVGERETRQKSASLLPKVGELVFLMYTEDHVFHDVFMFNCHIS